MSEDDYKYRAAIIIPMSYQEDANQLAKLIGPGGDAELLTFTTDLYSSDGEEPATHVACNTQLTENGRVAVLQAFNSEAYEDAMLRLVNDPASPHPDSTEEEFVGYPERGILTGLVSDNNLVKISQDMI